MEAGRRWAMGNTQTGASRAEAGARKPGTGGSPQMGEETLGVTAAQHLCPQLGALALHLPRVPQRLACRPNGPSSVLPSLPPDREAQGARAVPRVRAALPETTPGLPPRTPCPRMATNRWCPAWSPEANGTGASLLTSDLSSKGKGGPAQTPSPGALLPRGNPNSRRKALTQKITNVRVFPEDPRLRPARLRLLHECPLQIDSRPGELPDRDPSGSARAGGRGDTEPGRGAGAAPLGDS